MASQSSGMLYSPRSSAATTWRQGKGGRTRLSNSLERSDFKKYLPLFDVAHGARRRFPLLARDAPSAIAKETFGWADAAAFICGHRHTTQIKRYAALRGPRAIAAQCCSEVWTGAKMPAPDCPR